MALAASWITFALVAAFGLGGYMLCAKAGGGNLPPVIFATVMYTTGFIAVIPLFLVYMRDKPMSHLFGQPLWPLIFAGLAGISVILTDTSVAAMFGRGAPLSIGMMLVQLLALVLAVLFGVLFFSEKLSTVNVAGIILGFVAVAMLLYEAKPQDM